MNKKLLALAIAGALAPVAAMADSGNVVIYGQMNASIDSVNSGYTGPVSGQRTTQINDNQSRLGFKGTESLGNGLSAVWQIESSINADGANYNDSTANTQNANGSGASNGKLNQRNTFVGLTGGFGTAILGRHDTPYKLSTRNLDVFADNIADNRSIMGQSGAGTTFDGRQSNVVAYISPNFSGFTGAIGYVAGAENALTSGQQKGDAWSAMGNYANGPIYAALAYEKHNVGDAGTGTLADPNLGLANKNEKAWKIGGGYATDVFKVGLVYEKTSDDFGSVLGCGQDDCFGHHAWYLSGAYMFGNNAIKAAYTKTGNFGNTTDSSVKQYSIGFDHNMSKRTTVYALYTKLKNDTNAAFGLNGASNGGVTGGVSTPGALGSDPSAFSLGVKHSF
jgi:predicted porin